MIPYSSKLKGNARELRKNMTPEEKRLWYDLLKRLPMTAKRQHRIESYIVDFYIAEKKLVIEIDGRQHLMEENKKADQERDAKLKEWGIEVLRYSNHSINEDFGRITEHLLNRLGLKYSDLKKV